MHSIGEVVKQFEFHVPPLLHRIKGKIVKYTSAEGEVSYHWSISHYYKPSEGAAGVYFPSHVTDSSLEHAEMSFRAYAENFVPDYEVVAHDGF